MGNSERKVRQGNAVLDVKPEEMEPFTYRDVQH
jgi:hypothetical protein